MREKFHGHIEKTAAAAETSLHVPFYFSYIWKYVDFFLVIVASWYLHLQYSSVQRTHTQTDQVFPIYISFYTNTHMCVCVCDEWTANRLNRNGMCVVCCMLCMLCSRTCCGLLIGSYFVIVMLRHTAAAAVTVVLVVVAAAADASLLLCYCWHFGVAAKENYGPMYAMYSFARGICELHYE